MANRINPYQATTDSAAKQARVWPWWIAALLMFFSSTLVYIIGIVIAIFVRTDSIRSPEVFGFAFAPQAFAITLFLLLEFIYRRVLISLTAYVVALAFFIVLFAFAEEIYPVFIGVRKELLLPTVIGSACGCGWIAWASFLRTE